LTGICVGISKLDHWWLISRRTHRECQIDKSETQILHECCHSYPPCQSAPRAISHLGDREMRLFQRHPIRMADRIPPSACQSLNLPPICCLLQTAPFRTLAFSSSRESHRRAVLEPKGLSLLGYCCRQAWRLNHVRRLVVARYRIRRCVGIDGLRDLRRMTRGPLITVVRHFGESCRSSDKSALVHPRFLSAGDAWRKRVPGPANTPFFVRISV
jgi:hypothetical protein